MVKSVVFILTILLVSPKLYSQLVISVEQINICSEDSIKVKVSNRGNSQVYYCASLEVFYGGKWIAIIDDLWNSIPKTELFRRLSKKDLVLKKFYLRDFFIGSFKEYEYFKSRLKLKYSLSRHLVRQKAVYSDEFIISKCSQ